MKRLTRVGTGDVGRQRVPASASPLVGRMFALDVLRGVAVLLVLVWHWPGRTRGMGPFAAVSAVGWSGVDLFFVLSGFLISGLLYKEWDRTGSFDLRRFWLRRGFKIWPAYFAAFGLAMALRTVQNFRRGGAAAVVAEWEKYWPNVVFVQNYLPESRHWHYTWSVAVEEHFYIALPLLLLALGKWRGGGRGAEVGGGLERDGGPEAGGAGGARSGPFPALPLVALLVCAAALVMRIVAVRNGAQWNDIHYPTHLRADSLFFGVLLGYFYRHQPGRFSRVCRWWPLLLAVAAAALALAAAYPLKTSVVTYTAGFTLLYLAYGGVVALAAEFPAAGGRFGLARWVAAAGRYSYTIYLAHGAMQLMPRYGRTMSAAGQYGGLWAQRALFVGLALAGGVLLGRLVEQPLLRVRERCVPARG